MNDQRVQTPSSESLGCCAQCNGLKADAPLVTGDGYPPGGVHLHRECRRFWLAAQARAGSPTAKS
jgi:hypothetical protein